MTQTQIRHTPPRIEDRVPLVVGEAEEILGVIDTSVVPLTKPHLKVALHHQMSQTASLEVSLGPCWKLVKNEITPRVVEEARRDFRSRDKWFREARGGVVCVIE